jgi:hypothetical protein
MRFFANSSFTIHTSAIVPQVVARLQSQIEPIRYFRFLRPDVEYKEYQGRADADGFSIRLLWAGNYWSGPFVHGRFAALADGTDVHVTITPRLFGSGVLVYAIVFFAILAVAAMLCMVLGTVPDRKGDLSGVSVATGGLSMCLLFVQVWFSIQAQRTRRWLDHVINNTMPIPLGRL